MEFNERLKTLRKRANLTQSDFADKTGVHFQTVSKWERGASTPDISMLGAISKVLGVSLETLLGVSESENPITGDFDAMNMVKAIADYRKHNGLSQSDLAEKLQVMPDTVSKWERGVTLPDVDLLIKIASLFEVSPSLIYYGVKTEQTIEKPVFYTKSTSKKWMIFSLVICALFIASTILAIIFYPRPEEKIYHVVTIEGVGEFEVEDSVLFTQPEPKKSGYRFVKWINAQGEEVKLPCAVEEDFTLSPVYEVIEYTIDYWTNGGNLEGNFANVITVESGAIDLPIPKKTGEEFLGWYLSDDYQGESITTLSCNYQNVILYAKWENQVYGIHYVLDGGIMSNNPSIVTSTESITLTDPTKVGYVFLGWYDQKEGGNKYQTVGGENAKNLTLYALWQKTTQTYTINYELNGGVVKGENPSGLSAGESVRLNDAQKPGHNFLGWYDNNTQSANRYEWLTGQTDLTLYAIFAPKEYVIIYNHDGYYTGEPNKTHVIFGESFTLNPVIKEGYDFLGWYDAQENGNKIEEINENVISITQLYAIFVPKTYAINLYGNGGTFEIGDQTLNEHLLNYVYDTVFELPVCQREDYAFDYWADENGNIYSQITTLNCYTQAFYAHYTYSAGTVINYQLQGGELNSEYVELAYPDQVEELPIPVKYGNKFLGWNTNSDGTGVYYDTTDGLAMGEQVTIYAVWEEVLVVGTAENFEYTKSATQVTLTKYTGNKGENVDLIIPSFIDDLPVTELGSSFISASARQLNSIVLPQTLKVIKSECFYIEKINQPLIIPKSVHTIEQYAFRGKYASIVFEEGSALKKLTTGSFSEAKIYDVFELPEGLEEIKSSSLPVNCFGIKLPQSLKRVEDLAFDINKTGKTTSMNIYLPKGVTEVGNLAFGKAKIYTDATAESIAKYNPSWCTGYSLASEYVLTLKDGDTVVSQQTGIAFNLPILTKAGYNFVGWVDEDGKSVCKSYINTDFTNVTLYAHFAKAGANDGTSPDKPIIFDGTKKLVVTFSTAKTLYVYIDSSCGFFAPMISANKNISESISYSCKYLDENENKYYNAIHLNLPATLNMTSYLGKLLELDISLWSGYTMSQTFTFYAG